MPTTDAMALYDRGAETLAASWETYAGGARGAEVVRGPGVAIGVFPDGPERDVYNNALLARGLDAAGRRQAIAALEHAYAAAGVERYAAWVHEADVALSDALRARGYGVDTTTRAMGLDLADLRAPRPRVVLERATWPQYVEHLALDGLLAGADPTGWHVLMARAGGEVVASGLAFDRDGDCGIYNISTLPHARRGGLGTAITAALARDARDRGCTTASLQATPMAEGLYARLGFADLGRYVELVPAAAA